MSSIGFSPVCDVRMHMRRRFHSYAVKLSKQSRIGEASACALAADGPERQHGEAGGEGEPGQRVAEVGVAEADHRQAAAGPAAGVGSCVGVDEVGRDRAGQARGGGDGRRRRGSTSGRRPGSLRRRKPPPGSLRRRRPETVTSPGIWPSARVAGSRRSGGTKPRLTRTVKSGGLERREDPVAGAEVGDGEDRGLAVVEEAAGCLDAGVGVGAAASAGPGAGAGGGDRGGGEAGVDTGDEVELPGAALELPDAEGGEERRSRGGRRGRQGRVI